VGEAEASPYSANPSPVVRGAGDSLRMAVSDTGRARFPPVQASNLSGQPSNSGPLVRPLNTRMPCSLSEHQSEASPLVHHRRRSRPNRATLRTPGCWPAGAKHEYLGGAAL